MQEPRLFDMHVVDVNRTVKVTKGGSLQRFSALVVVGNGNGVVGWAMGKAPEVGVAVEKAYSRASRSLFFLERFENHTIFHNTSAKYGRSIVHMAPLPSGSGVRANQTVSAPAPSPIPCHRSPQLIRLAPRPTHQPRLTCPDPGGVPPGGHQGPASKGARQPQPAHHAARRVRGPGRGEDAGGDFAGDWAHSSAVVTHKGHSSAFHIALVSLPQHILFHSTRVEALCLAVTRRSARALRHRDSVERNSLCGSRLATRSARCAPRLLPVLLRAEALRRLADAARLAAADAHHLSGERARQRRCLSGADRRRMPGAHLRVDGRGDGVVDLAVQLGQHVGCEGGRRVDTDQRQGCALGLFPGGPQAAPPEPWTAS